MTPATFEKWAAELGFGAVGVCGFEPLAAHLLPVRACARLPHDAHAVIVLLAGYRVGDYPDRNLASYALPDDYHEVLLPKLQKLCDNLKTLYSENSFIPFVDSSPIPEVLAARLAGLGDIGCNRQLFSPIYGNSCFICEVVTDAPLMPRTDRKGRKLCTGCGRCVSACPTGALTPDGLLTEKCRSHITQKKGALSDWERAQVREGGLAWGCDLCIDACPLNREARMSEVAEFFAHIGPRLTLQNLPQMLSRKAYGWRGRAVLERNLAILEDRTRG